MGSRLFPEQGGGEGWGCDSEHSPPRSPVDAARREPRKHMGVTMGGTRTSTALFSFPPSILFLESRYSISSSPSSHSSNSSSTRLITGHLLLFLRSPAGYRLHPPHTSHRPKHPPSVRTCSLNFPQGHWVPPAGRQPFRLRWFGEVKFYHHVTLNPATESCAYPSSGP